MDKNISSRDGEPGLTQNSQPHRKVDQNEGLLAEAVVANPDDFRKRSRRRANVNSPDRGEELLNRQENAARRPCFGAKDLEMAIPVTPSWTASDSGRCGKRWTNTRICSGGMTTAGKSTPTTSAPATNAAPMP